MIEVLSSGRAKCRKPGTTGGYRAHVVEPVDEAVDVDDDGWRKPGGTVGAARVSSTRPPSAPTSSTWACCVSRPFGGRYSSIRRP